MEEYFSLIIQGTLWTGRNTHPMNNMSSNAISLTIKDHYQRKKSRPQEEKSYNLEKSDFSQFSYILERLSCWN